jgi:voltage-gated potassium channel
VETSTAPPAAGQPKSEDAATRLARYETRARIPIILSAVLPLIIAPQQGNPVSVAIGVITWLVFVFDLVMHRRLIQGYLSTKLGKFDLVVVVLTAPWFLLPGAQSGGIVVLLRLARLARLVIASRGAMRLFERLGRVAIVALAIMTACSFVAFYAEKATNPEFASFGDAMWWGIVTLTTVGYGDIVPITPTGRLAGTALMVTGVALLGMLAGALASFFGLDKDQPKADETDPPSADQPDAPEPATLDLVLAEVRELRARLDELQPVTAAPEPPTAGDPDRSGG